MFRKGVHLASNQREHRNIAFTNCATSVWSWYMYASNNNHQWNNVIYLTVGFRAETNSHSLNTHSCRCAIEVSSSLQYTFKIHIAVIKPAEPQAKCIYHTKKKHILPLYLQPTDIVLFVQIIVDLIVNYALKTPHTWLACFCVCVYRLVSNSYREV